MPREATVLTGPARTLAEFTRCELIVPRLGECDPAGILGELSRVLGRSGCVPDALSFYQAALHQESLCDSPTRSLIAVAHGRLGGVHRLQFALGRHPMPVLWSARNRRPVQLVFLLAVPATESACYLLLLSRLARLGQDAETVARLLAAPDAPALLAVLAEARLPVKPA